jgi:hypothetical protein
MGLMDTFNKDDRVELKVNELINYFRVEASTNAINEVLLNGVRARLPYDHILTMIGETAPVMQNDNNENDGKKD